MEVDIQKVEKSRIDCEGSTKRGLFLGHRRRCLVMDNEIDKYPPPPSWTQTTCSICVHCVASGDCTYYQHMLLYGHSVVKCIDFVDKRH